MSIEERILNIAEGPNWYDSRELRAIALDVRKMEERIKRLEREVELLRFYGNKDCTAQADEAATRWRDERFHPELSECKAKEDKP